MNRFAVFTIAGEEFGIELNRIVEIIKMQKATPILKVPAFISGVINLKGTIIPLMDMRKRFNVQASNVREKIIISKIHGEKVGLLIDSVKGIVNIEEKQISSPQSVFKGLKPEYILGIGKVQERLIIILNLDSLLTSDEIILLGERKENLSEKALANGS